MPVDLGVCSPLMDLFLRGDMPHDIRMLAARGGLTPDRIERVALIALMQDDSDHTVAEAAHAAAAAIGREELAQLLGHPSLPTGLLRWLERLSAPVPSGATHQTEAEADATASVTTGAALDEAPAVDQAPPMDQADAAVDEADGPMASGGDGAVDAELGDESSPQLLSALSVPARIKVAMLGTREQRAVLIRDPNRVVSSAVLSSPKLSDTEVENFARMSNVSAEVLRVIGTNRAWLKSYAVVAALVRNARTPPAISLSLMSRLQERDIKSLAVDRNVPEALRIAARKVQQTQHARRS